MDALYFLLAGALYYSQTVMAAASGGGDVPAGSFALHEECA